MESTHRWHSLVREWERALRAENKSKNTITVYGSSTRKLIDWLDETEPGLAEPADIARSHLRGWMEHLIDTTSAGNANTRYRSVQQWFNWLLDEGEIDTHPMQRMKPPVVPEKPVPLVPED